MNESGVIGPIDGYGRRHARRLRLARWLAPAMDALGRRAPWE